MARAHVYSLTLSYQQFQLKNNLVLGAMNDCMELLDDTIELLSNVINRSTNTNPSIHTFDDVQTWLSAALTNQETCIQSLQSHKLIMSTYSENTSLLGSLAHNLVHYITNSLALHVSSMKPEGSRRRLLLSSDSNFPTWASKSERKLLEASVEEIVGWNKTNSSIKVAVVAKDGSGTHKTIGEAVFGLLLKDGNNGRTVIHVKAGTYHENLKFSTKQKNVMLIGDGKGKSVIVSDRNSEEGWTTFQSATVAAMGDGFIARDITFVNNAGAAKHQAVALRVGADRSVVFRCSVIGYQDTLYTHSKRQFYRETDIYGTVDFIFGNSAVVLQNCNIYVRKSGSFQDNFVTAQGRSSPYQNTGISIHNCKIGAASDLVPFKSKVKTFLGRPWKQYSRTVVMQSFLDDCINPSGWSPWSGNSGLKTVYYGEYMNSGPGASTSGRVKWAGYHPSLTSLEAQAFTVAGFISGNQWLPSTGVSFDSGLLG
ncbi:Pectinesterase, catalytic [Corchorus olitorius]|uniref:Pectinesterase n=1 Tax=Corchorus olitorius TaxID=93759 RepID=A0A1R3K9R4_9ROSI|nr:Pectinesterase, catalytic [Corchorus olitorius]